ncbi:excise [Mycobacterium phage Xavia]|uniref:Excise n=1 Tax=Mycobacterium phage Xavia TaxID=2178923 RepID=A0A2U8UI07_9CAUD|nr:excise [Mycobacterium phage Xavia]AWN02645.1 excise [Mycobacterium phage Xavia]
MSDNWLNNWQSTSAKLGGISRAKVFQLWKSGALGSVVLGTRRFSTDEQIANFIASLPTSTPGQGAA